MYHHLRGKLIELGSLSAVVETSGVGWHVQVPLSTRSLVGDRLGEEVLLYTHLLVREDVLKLFGFSTLEERELFRLLLSVSGTGPKIALQALSAFSVKELIRDLGSGDVDSLKRIKGGGKKLAERMVLELRDKAGVLQLGEPGSGAEQLPEGGGGRVSEIAITVLVEQLGFSLKDARKRVEAACQKLSGSDSPASAPSEAEEIIRVVLESS
ncbi:MAG: Holliday junction branch migration protein RuvA [Planctomycetes bacterium]|nr:Holliday junction branch migration protein RuvA [Planctomycetota bacterium]